MLKKIPPFVFSCLTALTLILMLSPMEAKAETQTEVEVEAQAETYNNWWERLPPLSEEYQEQLQHLLPPGNSLREDLDQKLAGEQEIRNFHEVVRSGNLKQVRHMLNNGADPNARAHDKTALIAAVESGQDEALQLLIQRGGNERAKDPQERTLLHFARKISTAQFLLDLGLDVNAKTVDGHTPRDNVSRLLDYTNDSRYADLGKFLRQKGGICTGPFKGNYCAGRK